MSSYINFMFKYLFQSEQLSGELLRQQQQLQGAPNQLASAGANQSAGAANYYGFGAFQSSSMAPTPPSRCLALASLISAKALSNFSGNNNTNSNRQQQQQHQRANGHAARSFIEFEQQLRRALQLTITVTTNNSSPSGHSDSAFGGSNQSADLMSATTSQQAAELANQELLLLQQTTPAAATLADQQAGQLAEQRQLNPSLLRLERLELLECFNQLQLSDYYNGYDIFIGLRIASTLTILFIVFILFVIYKTGCRSQDSSGPTQAASSSTVSFSAISSSSRPPSANRKRRRRQRQLHYYAGCQQQQQQQKQQQQQHCCPAGELRAASPASQREKWPTAAAYATVAAQPADWSTC